MDTATADPLIGVLLDGRYRVDARVARGGMATVYTGFDTRLDRVVAIKVMHATLADDDDFVARFHREAKAAARLSHPNVVAIYDQGEDAGRVFLVMEYVDGGTLRERLRTEGRLSPAAALAVMEPVLQALAAAHDAGIVHRDIKPENILVAADGRVKVADFGLARAIEASGHTTTGLLIGSVNYLAPEQVETGGADTRTDVYAAGIVLFEMLTGTPPYDGDSPLSIAYRHVNDVVPAPSSLLLGVPPELDELVVRATQRRPADRHSDASMLLAGVRRVQQSISASRPSAALRPLDDAPTVVTPLPRGADGDGHRTALLDRPPPPPLPADVRRRRLPRPSRTTTITLALALLFAIAGVVGWQLGANGIVGSVTVPNVVNRPVADARQRLAPTFAVSTTEEHHETVAKGNVIRQTPAAGTKVRRSSAAVALVVSLGPDRVAVPNLVGKTKEQAAGELADERLKRGRVVEAYSEEHAAGIVLVQNPKPGEQVKPGNKVELQVSKGPKPIAVPNLVGKTRAKAEAALKKLGLKADITEEHHDKIAKGKVISQTPKKGTLVRGETVKLVVSKGPPPVQVPNVVGRSRGDAERILREHGLRARFEDFEDREGGQVISQSPRPGSTVPKGSTITLYMF